MGVDQDLSRAATAYQAAPLSAQARTGLVEAMRRAINEQHRTKEQISQLTGISDPELSNLLNSI